MEQKHNSIKRIIHRCIEELRATYDVAKTISLKVALIFSPVPCILSMQRSGYRHESLYRTHHLLVINYAFFLTI